MNARFSGTFCFSTEWDALSRSIIYRLLRKNCRRIELQRVLKAAHLGIAGYCGCEKSLALVVRTRADPDARLKIFAQFLALVGLVDDKVFDKRSVGLGVHLLLGKIINLFNSQS